MKEKQMGETTCPKCGALLDAGEFTDEDLQTRWDGYISGRKGLPIDNCPYKDDGVPRWTTVKSDWKKLQQWKAGWHIGVRAAQQIQELPNAPH